MTASDSVDSSVVELTIKLWSDQNDPFYDSFQRLKSTHRESWSKSLAWLWDKGRYRLDRALSSKDEYTMKLSIWDLTGRSQSEQIAICNQYLATHKDDIISWFLADTDLSTQWNVQTQGASLHDQFGALKNNPLELEETSGVIRGRTVFTLSGSSNIEVVLESWKRDGEYKIEIEGQNHEMIQKVAEIIGLSQPISHEVITTIADQTRDRIQSVMAGYTRFSPGDISYRMLQRLRMAKKDPQSFEYFLVKKYFDPTKDSCEGSEWFEACLNKKFRKIERLYGMYHSVIEEYYLEELSKVSSSENEKSGNAISMNIYKKLSHIFCIFWEKIDTVSLRSLLELDGEYLQTIIQELKQAYEELQDQQYGEETLTMIMRSLRICYHQSPDLDLSKGLHIFYPYIADHLKDASMHLYGVISKQLTRDKQSFDQDDIKKKLKEFAGIYTCFHQYFNFAQAPTSIYEFLDEARLNFKKAIKFDDPIIWPIYQHMLGALCAYPLDEETQSLLFRDSAQEVSSKKEEHRTSMIEREVLGSKSTKIEDIVWLLTSNAPELWINMWKENMESQTFRASLRLFSYFFTENEGALSLSPLFYQTLGMEALPGGKSSKPPQNLRPLIKKILDSGIYSEEKKSAMWPILIRQYDQLPSHVASVRSLAEFLQNYPNDVFFIQMLLLASFDAIHKGSGYLMNSLLKNLANEYTDKQDWSPLSALHLDRRAAGDTEIDWKRYDAFLHKFSPIHNKLPQVDRKMYVLTEDPHINTFYLKNIALEILKQLLAGQYIDLAMPISESVFREKISIWSDSQLEKLEYAEYLQAFLEYRELLSRSKFIDQDTKKIADTPESSELRRFLKFSYFCSRHTARKWYSTRDNHNGTASTIIQEMRSWTTKDGIDAWVTVFGHDLFAQLKFIVPEEKQFGRTLEKLIFKYAGNISEIGDKFRATITVPDFSSISWVLAHLTRYYHEKYGEDIDSISIEDDTQNPLAKLMPNGAKNPNPTGFRNATLAIGLKNGHMIEIQIVPETYYQLKTKWVNLQDDASYGFILSQIASHRLCLTRDDIDQLSWFIPDEGVEIDVHDTLHAGFLPLCDSSWAARLTELLSQKKLLHVHSWFFATDNLYHLHRVEVMPAELRKKLQGIEQMLYESVHGKLLFQEYVKLLMILNQKKAQ